MTYILGSRCNDGVVLIADRAFTVDYGTQTIYEDKLFQELPHTVIGFSGDKGMFELFRTHLAQYASNYFRDHDQLSEQTFILQTSEIIAKINARFPRSESFDAILALGLEDGPAQLKYFYPDGRLESILRYKAIGGGAPYGSAFLNHGWNMHLKMNQVAEIGYFNIKFIEALKLDNTVGVGSCEPQIWFVPDNTVKTYQLVDSGILKKLQANTRARLEKIRGSLTESFTF